MTNRRTFFQSVFAGVSAILVPQTDKPFTVDVTPFEWHEGMYASMRTVTFKYTKELEDIMLMHNLDPESEIACMLVGDVMLHMKRENDKQKNL